MTLWTPPGADLGEHAGPEPDDRMVHFIGGVDAQGRPLPTTFRRLKKRTEAWPVTHATPDGPAMLLKTAREMFAHGFYVYEFVATSCSWAINAVEAALKLRLEQRGSFQRLISAAVERGILPAGAGEALEAGRQIRNGFVHDGTQPVWTFGMADMALRTPHIIVAELFPDSPAASLQVEEPAATLCHSNLRADDPRSTVLLGLDEAELLQFSDGAADSAD